ncbi:WD40 repeat domain-containing protein [Micromonospora chalcea]
MSGLWRTVWATGQDIPRMGRLVRTGPVLALDAGGDDLRPLAAAVAGRSPADAAGDRLQVWDIVSGQLTTATVEAAVCVAVGASADGAVAVTGHSDGTVRVWALPDLTMLRSWRTGRQGVEDVRVAGPAPHAVVVTLGADGAVARWSLETGGPLGTLGVPESLAICAGRLVSGRHVVVAAGREVSLWDAHSGQRLPLPVADQQTPGGIAAALLSARDGRDVLTVVTGPRELVMFDVATGAQVGGRVDAHVDDFPPHQGRMWGGKRARPRLAMVNGTVAVPTKWRVHLWDLPAATPAGPSLPGPVRTPVLASVRWEGRDWLLTGSAEDGMVGLWDPDAPPQRSAGFRQPVARLAMAESGVVVCADEGGTIAAHRAEDGSLVTAPTNTQVRGVVSLAAWVDGTRVRAATGAGSPDASHPWVQRWDLMLREQMQPPIKVSVPQVRHVGMAKVRGERVLVVIDRELLRLQRADDGTLIDEVRKERGTYRLVTGPSEGGPIAVVSAIGRPPEVFRLDRLSAPPSPMPGLDGGFVAALDGTRLVAGSLAERRSGWRTAWACDLTGRPLGPEVVGAPITSVAIATWPAVFIARADGTVSLIDLESGQELCPALQLPAEPRSIAIDDLDVLVGVGADVARFTPPVAKPLRREPDDRDRG